MFGEEEMINIQNLANKIIEQVDTKIYRIISGKFKIRKDGELDMRFKENLKSMKGGKKL